MAQQLLSTPTKYFLRSFLFRHTRRSGLYFSFPDIYCIIRYKEPVAAGENVFYRSNVEVLL